MRKTIVLSALLAMLFAAIACADSPPAPQQAPTRSNDELARSAFYACTLFIERQLGLPTGRAQRYSPSLVARSGSGFGVEVHYASTGVTYACAIARHDNGDMQLLALYRR